MIVLFMCMLFYQVLPTGIASSVHRLWFPTQERGGSQLHLSVPSLFIIFARNHLSPNKGKKTNRLSLRLGILANFLLLHFVGYRRSNEQG